MFTLRKAIDYAATHALGGALSALTPEVEVGNRALLELSSRRTWKFFERNMRLLRSRARFNVTDGVWVLSSRTITLAGAFAGYSFVPGDYILVTATDGAVLGQFFIKSRTSDDAVVLTEDSGAELGADATITFSVDVARVSLPSDLGEVIKFEDSSSVTGLAIPCSMSELLIYRTQYPTTSRFETKFSLGFATAGTGTEPTPVMEIWPEQTSASDTRFALYYRAEPRELVSDNSVIELPKFMHPLFIDVLTAVCRGYESRGKFPIEQELGRVFAGATYQAAARHDSTQMRNTGKPKHSAYTTPPTISFGQGLVNAGKTIIID